MKNYSDIEWLINYINAYSDKELKNVIEEDIQEKFYNTQAENRTALIIYVAIFMVFEAFFLKIEGFSVDLIISTAINLLFLSPISLSLTFGIFSIISRPISSFNLFKAKKINKKYKKLNVDKIIAEENFDDPDFVEFLKSFNIDAEKYKKLSQNELEEIFSEINTIPNFIRTKIKKRMIDLMLDGRELREDDKNTIKKIIKETIKIKNKNEGATHLIENLFNDVNKNEEEYNLFLKVDKIKDKIDIENDSFFEIKNTENQ